MSVAIEKRDEKIDSLENRLRNLRRSADAEAKELMGTGAAVGTAYAFGAMEKRAENRGAAIQSPVDGVDPKIAYGAGMYIAGRLVGGDAGLALQNGGKSLLIIKAYQSGRESAGSSR